MVWRNGNLKVWRDGNLKVSSTVIKNGNLDFRLRSGIKGSRNDAKTSPSLSCKEREEVWNEDCKTSFSLEEKESPPSRRARMRSKEDSNRKKEQNMDQKQKKLTVDQENCIGCGTCIALCPDVFAFNKDGKSYVKDQEACENCDCQSAIDSCPVGVIHWDDKTKKEQNGQPQ